MSELQEVNRRLTVLETQAEERYISHKTESKIIWGTINEKLDVLLKHKDAQDGRKDDCMKESKGHANRLVAYVLGIPTTLGTIIGIIWGVKRLLLMTLLCLLLCGCSITTEFYVDDVKVGHIKQDQAGQAILKGKDIEMSVDTRKPTAWERFITPMVSGAVSAARENAGAAV